MAHISESLYVGGLAEYEGQKGLILDLLPDGTKAEVALVTGNIVKADANKLKVPKFLGAPDHGDDKESFDIFLGPMHKVDMFGELISTCLFEKGFCVIKVCHREEEISQAHSNMEAMAEEGRLMRLAIEVEEGYLGVGSKGKVAWVEEGTEDSPTDPLILEADDLFSQLLSSISPYSHDSLGGTCSDRTPGLASLSLEGSDHIDYPNPIPEDKVLGDFLKRWRSGLVRGVHYMGPELATVNLIPRDEDGAHGLPIGVDNVTISATPNTIILYRPSIFKYSVLEPGNTLSLSVMFMKAQQRLVLDAPGDTDVLGDLFYGPAPPSGGMPLCDHAATRMAANWDDPKMYTGSQTVGCDACIEFPRTRFDWDMYYNPDAATAEAWNITMKHMAMVEGLENFDNKYFSIPANEAVTMGPMQRHMLETGALAMAKMGITKKVADREPHHAGCSVGLDKDDWPGLADKAPQCQGGNNVIAIISNRFSFTFNLKGVNYVADTACSASLVATHFARWCMRDRTHDALEFFVCMGVHNNLSLALFMGAGQLGVQKGRCFTFNDTADGYTKGDSCSGFIMKWGTKDDDYTAIWRGSMTGQNGRSATLTAPNGLSQEDVCRKAIREAGATPAECVVWSCHGTGTSLGDPIEIGACRKIHRGEREESSLCVNTNKTNHGHFEGGAAMTSLLSAFYQCAMCKVNPNQHLNVFNGHIVMDSFYANFYNEIASWDERTQGHVHVSSFGFGGTNGHAVFWGKDTKTKPTDSARFSRRLLSMAPPEIRPIGPNPDDWEHDLPDDNILPGDVYSIYISKSDPIDAPIRYVKTESGLEDGSMESDTAYSISGNFNEWTADAMDRGDVPGMSIAYLEVPEDGQLEFNFCKTVQEELVLAPEKDNCTRKTANVIGPAEGLTNKWVVTGVPGSDMKISLFTSLGITTVSWVPVGSSKGKSSISSFLDEL